MYEDPGWRQLWHRSWLLLIPGGILFLMRRRMATVDGLTRIRTIFAGLILALFLFGIVLLFIVEADRRLSTDRNLWFALLVLGVGCATSLAVHWVRSRRLDVSSRDKVAASFLSVMFIGIGYAETTALVAFVGTFVMQAYWIYFVGLAFSIINLFLVGPTRREIARRQQQIAAQGSSLSLGAALVAMPPGRPKS